MNCRACGAAMQLHEPVRADAYGIRFHCCLGCGNVAIEPPKPYSPAIFPPDHADDSELAGLLMDGGGKHFLKEYSGRFAFDDPAIVRLEGIQKELAERTRSFLAGLSPELEADYEAGLYKLKLSSVPNSDGGITVTIALVSVGGQRVAGGPSLLAP